jgi:hypothetical protein
MYWGEYQNVVKYQFRASSYLQMHRPVLRRRHIHHELGDIVCLVKVVGWIFEEPQGSHHEQGIV